MPFWNWTMVLKLNGCYKSWLHEHGGGRRTGRHAELDLMQFRQTRESCQLVDRSHSRTTWVRS
jgi:hypothetical protein